MVPCPSFSPALLVVLFLLPYNVVSFLPPSPPTTTTTRTTTTTTTSRTIMNRPTALAFLRTRSKSPHSSSSSIVVLKDGFGQADTYSWTEDAVEMEIRIPVPKNTKAKDVIFQAKPLSVHVELRNMHNKDSTTSSSHTKVLLNGTRTMRGRVAMDGTFWNLEDPTTTMTTFKDTTNDKNVDANDDANDDDHRILVVTIEKNTRAPADDFQIVDYDWGGVYPQDEEEVISRTYLEPEEMNIEEYAASLGVDIHNLNMSLVDKSMFTTGLHNMTRDTMERSLGNRIQEVTQQSDGTEYITDPETGEAIPYSPYGDSISPQEVADATRSRTTSIPAPTASATNTETASSTGTTIPFIDTTSPWSKTAPSYNMDALTKELNEVAAAMSKDGETKNATKVKTTLSSSSTSDIENNHRSIVDDESINHMTVNHLKEKLRSSGLPVSGNKAQLIQRWKTHIKQK